MKIKSLTLSVIVCFVLIGSTTAQKPLDILILGDVTSEKSHTVRTELSERIVGGSNEPARILLPKPTPDWEGGTLSFVIKVDPTQQNYLTLRLWGSDKGSGNALVLFCEGKQVGYRHLGDYDLLDYVGKDPAYQARFIYITHPLPIQATKGKKEIALSIRAFGPIWGYGETFEKYQKPMDTPSRGIYRVYSHTSPCFVPASSEKQGKEVAALAIRKAPGPEVLTQLKTRLNQELLSLLDSAKQLNQIQMSFLARAYYTPWTNVYQHPCVAKTLLASMDNYYHKYATQPDFAYHDPDAYNNEWLGMGAMGEAIALMNSAFGPALDERLAKESNLTRRKAYADLLHAHVVYGITHRRQYTNQSMIIDLYTYYSNKGLRALNDPRALPEKQLLRYLYESVGLEPWLGSETPNGPEKPLGESYFQLTAQGLTKELGYVGYYGEVLDWVAQIYKATGVQGKPNSGDQRLREQLLKMEKARSYFRYPAMDAQGNRAMRIEAVVGWRDAGHYPGDVCYGERSGWEGSSIYAAAATLDPHAIGAVQQLFGDNQFFESLQDLLNQGGARIFRTLLPVIEDYEVLMQQPAQPYRLPMSKGQPDFVFSDEEDGVIAFKNKDDIFYASLYWRARLAINNLARIHYITPAMDRIATVFQQTRFTPSGMMYTRPDWVNLAFSGQKEFYPGIHSAHAGETLPIAKVPEGIPFKPGDENVFAGKGDFYTLSYGPYLIAMNCTNHQTFDLAVPTAFQAARNLVSQKDIGAATLLKVAPKSTVVLYQPNAGNPQY